MNDKILLDVTHLTDKQIRILHDLIEDTSEKSNDK